MKNYPHIMAKVFREPWLIRSRDGGAIVQLLLSRIEDGSGGITLNVEEPDEPELAIDGRTAVIPVHGIIGKHLSMLEAMCGGCDLDTVQAMTDEAERDEDVSTILFDFRTPGGTVTGIPEFGRRIARIQKRTIAFSDSQCCSGGQWLASQCRESYGTQSSEWGSIGVWSAYMNYAQMLRQEGVEVQEISAGKYKTMGAYWKPLSDEEKDILKTHIQKLHADFKDAITSRREVSAKHMEGQVFDGQQAVEVGLLDGLVEDISELLPAD